LQVRILWDRHRIKALHGDIDCRASMISLPNSDFSGEGSWLCLHKYSGFLPTGGSVRISIKGLQIEWMTQYAAKARMLASC